MKIVFMKFGTKRQLFLNFDVMLLTPVYLDHGTRKTEQHPIC